MAEKRDIELRHDTLLRKFEYNKALDQVLRPYVMRKKPEVKDGMRTDTRRYKKMTSHRYLQHTAFTPSPGDEVVMAEKRDIELRHDTLLRKFEYNKALDQVLRPYVMRKKPEYTYSLLMELSRREGLRRALAACEERSLCKMLQFVNRNISDSR